MPVSPNQDREQPVYSFADLASVLHISAGKFDAGKRTLFSTFRDEMFFCQAFFDHYRHLGVEQFLIIDDHSTDGTSAFLESQPDCVVLRSSLAYGDRINIEYRSGRKRNIRADIYFKMAVPNHFFDEQYVLYVDADEFLFLPPKWDNLKTLFAMLKSKRISNVLASIVEFYPETVNDLVNPVHPQTFNDLLAAYPYFRAEPLQRLGGKKGYKVINRTKTNQLFEKYNIRPIAPKLSFFQRIQLVIQVEKPNYYRKTPQYKTPIIFASKDSYLVGTHRANKPCSDQVMLTIAHFVFTQQLADKIDRARKWRSYSNRSEKYDQMYELMDKMRAENASFIDEKTERFSSSRQFLECGLMVDLNNS